MKKIIFLLLCFFALFIDVKAFDVYSNNAVLYNLNDDKIIFEKNLNSQVKVASLTKIMTTIVALENIDNIKDTVVMPRQAFYGLDGYVTSGIKAGDVVTYEDLLYGIMLPSGADCANAIAILVSTDIDSFVQLMNDKARELNLQNTHFSNPIGKDDNNYSTVGDIAIILKYALQNDDFFKIFTTREYVTSSNLKFSSTLIEKRDKYNLDVSNILGSKTGFTDEAGYCLASIAYIDNVRYLLVTANASTSMPYQVIDAINVYDYFSSNYSYKQLLQYNQELVTLDVDGIFNSEYVVYSNNDVYKYLNNDVDMSQIVYEYDGDFLITSKMKKGDYIGKVNAKYGENILYTYDVYLDRGFINYNYLFISVFIVFFLLIVLIVRYIYKYFKKSI